MDTKVVIIYHSGYGHTAKVAESISKGAIEANANVSLIRITEEKISANDWEKLDAADAIIFGAPTYMGSVSGQFKLFAEATSLKWSEQKWKDKVAAAFTNSSSYSGDKLSTIQQIFHLAMQHSMIWVGQAEMAPSFGDNEMPSFDLHNRLGSWSGLMTQANHKSLPDKAPPVGDLATAHLFGKRVASIANSFKSSKS